MNDWRDYDNSIVDKLKGLIDSYVQSTHYLVYLNEIYNTNSYIHANLSEEQSKLDTLHDKARNNVYKAKHRYLTKTYNMHANQFRTRLVHITLFMILFVLLIVALYYQDVVGEITTAISIGLILIVYVIWLWLIVKENNHRRKTDWNKYNFGTMTTRKRGSCPA